MEKRLNELKEDFKMNIRGLHNYIEGRESFKCSVCGEFYDVDKRFFPVCCPYCGYGRNSSLLLDATVERALQNIEISILKRIDTQIEICKEMIKRDMLEENEVFDKFVFGNKQYILAAEHCKEIIKNNMEGYKYIYLQKY